MSAKLAEGNVIIIDKEAQDTLKTQNLKRQLDNFGLDDPLEKSLFILPYEADDNFQRASNKIRHVTHCAANRVNVLKLMEHRRVVFTLESLQQMQQDLSDRKQMRFSRQKAGYKKAQYPSIAARKALGLEKLPVDHSLESLTYDAEKPLDLKFQVLRDYMEKYETLKKEDKLEPYMTQRRKSRVHPDDI